ncbi:hypothetical protein ANCCAN_02050 [Ancylostoma caninum]|uniref:Uncharacterized protein n=1 Tax=Ancylostoma caninum TaxID=29170 RepID=A0A368H506_ANCCA|nr:hypothetical protein ANCCAN_02050 [Ancylostoma caninum]
MEIQDDDARDFSDGEEERIRSAIPEAINIELRDYKVSARYKERHCESLSKRIEAVCVKVKSLKENCKLCVLHESVYKALEQMGIESKQEWEEYLRTIERDGELLAEVVKIVKQVKQKADAHESDKMDDGRVPVNSESMNKRRRNGLERAPSTAGNNVQRRYRQDQKRMQVSSSI